MCFLRSRFFCPSKCCSRCSAGPISTPLVVPNRAPAAALPLLQVALPLQRWPRSRASVLPNRAPAAALASFPFSVLASFPRFCPSKSCPSEMRCCVVFRYAIPCLALQCSDTQCFDYAMSHHAMTGYALPWSSTPCYAVLYHAARTFSESLPCSTSDCANIEEIYVMVRDGREG